MIIIKYKHTGSKTLDKSNTKLKYNQKNIIQNIWQNPGIKKKAETIINRLRNSNIWKHIHNKRNHLIAKNDLPLEYLLVMVILLSILISWQIA